jgi:hypothetical protein
MPYLNFLPITKGKVQKLVADPQGMFSRSLKMVTVGKATHGTTIKLDKADYTYM